LNLPVSAHNYKENLATCFFRICQEALTNVAKHSGATEVEIRIKQEGEKLIMEVSDNGHGIPKEHIRHPHSFGLTGMRERAIIIGGELEISGRENKGTTVILKANTNLE
jgi:signal transduction histidine kinase